MRIRRCALLRLESQEETRFELGALLSGGTGVVSRMRWLAHAPALESPMELDAGDIALLGEISPTDWVEAAPVRQRFGAAPVRRLLRAGLLVGSTKPWASAREKDERLRMLHWHGVAADYHRASRWRVSEILCERHTMMLPRSMYATQEEDAGGHAGH